MSKTSVPKTCTICLENITDPALNNGCNHEFCFICIELWARTTNTCPVCKKRFTELTRVNSLAGTKRKPTKGRVTRSITRVKVAEKDIEPTWDRDELARLDVTPEHSESDVDDANEDSEQQRRNARRRRAQRIGSPEPDEDFLL